MRTEKQKSEYKREWYKRNVIREKAKRREWYLKNRLFVIQRVKKYRLNNLNIIKENKKQYYLKNKERFSIYRIKQYEMKGEIIKIRAAKYRKLYPNRVYLTKKSWRERNRKIERARKTRWNQTQKGRLSHRVQQLRRRQRTADLSLIVVQQVYEENIRRYDTLTCELCFKSIKFGEDSLEHFIPVSRGGSNERENLGVAHSLCNSKKGIMALNEWRKCQK